MDYKELTHNVIGYNGHDNGTRRVDFFVKDTIKIGNKCDDWDY